MVSLFEFVESRVAQSILYVVSEWQVVKCTLASGLIVNEHVVVKRFFV